MNPIKTKEIRELIKEDSLTIFIVKEMYRYEVGVISSDGGKRVKQIIPGTAEDQSDYVDVVFEDNTRFSFHGLPYIYKTYRDDK